jgi:hypothetical protein
MAKMKLSPAVATLSGKLGNMVHRQLWGQHVVSPPPDFTDRVLSADQVAQNDKYRNAAMVWDALAADVKAGYKAWGKRLNKPPYALFNKNFSRPPSVEEIDLSQYAGQAGQTIGIRAVDLFEVAGVEVTVRAAGGNVVEKGAAVKKQGEKYKWAYQTTVAAQNPVGLSVEAMAKNWPGKQGNRVQLLTAPGT